MVLSLLAILQAASPDTLSIRSIADPPASAAAQQIIRYGLPQLRIRTGQGFAPVWLLRSRDTVFIAAVIPDSTPYWGDDFVVSLDTRGDGAPSPQHDDFQLHFRRIIDSSVVYRGRNGRWEPPRGDPDWRLGTERSGGGWEVSAADDGHRWRLLLRLDPAWFLGENGRLPRVAFRVYDDAPGGWFSSPLPSEGAPAKIVEDRPSLWSPVRALSPKR